MKGSDKGKPMVAAPGELYSTAQGAPVASTELIYDYLKEKSQETINTEVLLKLNELEANQGGNDGLSEQQVLNKIDASLQSLNTENSGTLGSAVAALASAVGNNTSGRSHETRIAALESTSPTDYSERLNTIEGNISDLGTGLGNTNTSIQSEEARAKGEESRLEGLINSLDGDIEDLNNGLNNINLNILLQFKEKRIGTISDTSRFHAETTGCNPTAVFYYEQYKRFMVERNGQIFGYWGCGNAYNDYSPNGEDATPFKNRIYVDLNKLVYTWDGVTLRALGLLFENSSDDSGSQEDPEEKPVTIPEIAYGSLNTATEYSYYTVTETTSGVKYKIGTLLVVNSPEGMIQILTTPKNIDSNTYESDSIHVYVRSKQGNNWASWIEDAGGGNPITTINTNKVNDVPFNKNQLEINDILNRYINLERGTFNEVTTDMLLNKSVTMEKLSSTVYEYIHNIDDMMGELSNQSIKLSNLINEVNTLKALQSQNLFTEISVEGLFIVDKLGNIGACIAPATITNGGSTLNIVVNYGWNGSGSMPEGIIEWKPGKGQKLVLDVDFSQTTNFDPIQDELYAIKFNIPSKDSTDELLKFQAVQKSDSSYEGLRLMIEADCVKLGNSYFYYIDSNNNEVQIPYSEIEIVENYDPENETQYRWIGHTDVIVQQSERPEEPYAEKNLQFEIVSGSNYTYLEPVQEVDGKTYLVLKINSGVSNKNVTVRCTDTTTDTTKDITVNVTFAIPGYNFTFTVEDNNNTLVGEGENGIPYVTTISETNSFDVGFQADGQSNEVLLVNVNDSNNPWWSLPSIGIQPVTMTKNLQQYCRLLIVKDVVNKTFTLTYNLKYKDLYYGDPEEFSIGYLKKQIKVSYQQSSGGSDSGTTPNLGGRGVIVDDASSLTQVTEIGTHTKTLYLKDASTGAILKAEWVGDDSLNLDVHNDEEVPYVEVTVLDTTKEFYVLNASAIIE